MNSELEFVLERDKQRYQMLRAIYLTARGDVTKTVNFAELASAHGLNQDEAKDALSYLQEEKLIEQRLWYRPTPPVVVMGKSRPRLKNHLPGLPVPWQLRGLYGNEASQDLSSSIARLPATQQPALEVHLTHKGRKEVEQSIKHPNGATEHFPKIVIQNFYDSVGVVQNAPDSTAHIIQKEKNDE
jgi:hypothetical protein